MQINWDVTAPGAFDSEPLILPTKYEFPQGFVYRMKLTNIPGHAGVELYPTIEVASVTPRSAAFLAHNTVPVAFTNEDFIQVLGNNFVTKVVYLPDPEFQQIAVAGVDTLVSTRLDPGVDPVVEADRKGTILAVVRMGNKDLQTAGAGVGVMPAGFNGPCPQPGMPGYVAGMTMPQYGMPMSGTPIGLPGPPHIPLGAPAGMQRHTMVNHTPVHVPGPTDHVRIDVRQAPGMSYPAPANHVRIVERAEGGAAVNTQPFGAAHQTVGGNGAPCPPAAPEVQ
jgi:hypothetical protein